MEIKYMCWKSDMTTLAVLGSVETVCEYIPNYDVPMVHDSPVYYISVKPVFIGNTIIGIAGYCRETDTVYIRACAFPPSSFHERYIVQQAYERVMS